MVLVRMSLVIGALAAAVGCGEPHVTSCSPVPIAGSRSTSTSESHETQPETAGKGGSAASEELEPCPDGYMCTDLSAIGAKAMDGDGNEIKASCGMGSALVDCDDADPAGSCPGLTKPICAHISVAGMNLVGCGQVCKP